MLQTFDNIISIENTKLYNGKRYFSVYKYSEENHNYYSSANFLKGDVVYDNAPFYNVSLKYDILSDQLIFEPNGDRSFINIELISDKVLSFKLENHQFVNSKTIKENNTLFSGYIEILFSTPKLKLYVKHQKLLKRKIVKNKIVYLFINKPRFYILFNNELKEIKSNNSFKKIFPDFDKELKLKIKENKKMYTNNQTGFYLFITKWVHFKLKSNSTN